jgi:hypothetical protein
MSELNKLFEHAPEGAVELREYFSNGYFRWFNKGRDAWGGDEWFPTGYEEYRAIATRPQPEQKTVEESEPEWTHIIEGRKCKIVLNEPDVDEDIVVLRESGAYHFACYDQLKPIKPTISTDRALGLMKKMCPDEWTAVEKKYDITN